MQPATTTAAAPATPSSPRATIYDDSTADFGDFVRDEDEEIDLDEVVEPWHKYDINATPRVFYPICLGEVLNDRYLIEHKLGAGGFSTVWMAHDLVEKKDVAIKVMARGSYGDHEIFIQDEILRTVKDTSHLVTYQMTFILPGLGQHRAMVLPLRGPCLDTLAVKKMTMATRMSAAKQLLETLKDLHDAGIVHRGRLAIFSSPFLGA